jgi:hypothetical protein
MSAIVKTATPFLNKELLLQALENIGCKYTLQGNDILTDRIDYYGIQKFSFLNGRYVFLHDSSAEYNSPYMNASRNYPWGNINNQQYKSVSEFLQAVGEEYEKLYQKKLEELERQRLEEEQKRLEQERLAYIENLTNQITQKAKEEGYTIKKEKVKGKVKIVLTKNTY